MGCTVPGTAHSLHLRLPFLAVAILSRIFRSIHSLCASRRQVTRVKACGPLRHRSGRRPVPDDRDPGGHPGLLVFLPVTTPGNPSRAGIADPSSPVITPAHPYRAGMGWGCPCWVSDIALPGATGEQGEAPSTHFLHGFVASGGNKSAPARRCRSPSRGLPWTQSVSVSERADSFPLGAVGVSERSGHFYAPAARGPIEWAGFRVRRSIFYAGAHHGGT